MIISNNSLEFFSMWNIFINSWWCPSTRLNMCRLRLRCYFIIIIYLRTLLLLRSCRGYREHILFNPAGQYWHTRVPSHFLSLLLAKSNFPWKFGKLLNSLKPTYCSMILFLFWNSFYNSVCPILFCSGFLVEVLSILPSSFAKLQYLWAKKF